MNFGTIGQVVAAECPKEFVDLILAEAPIEADIFCIEGEILRHAAIQQELAKRLREQNIKPWLVSPTP